MEKENKNKALFLVFISALITGLIAPITKIGLKELDPISFMLLRFILASIAITIIYKLNKELFSVSLLKLVPISLFAAANIVLFAYGMEKSSATMGVIMYAATPILTTFFASVLTGKKVTLSKWVYLAVGLCGVIFIVLFPQFETALQSTGSIIGNLLLLSAVTCWSLYMVRAKQVQKNYSLLSILLVLIYTTTIVLLILALTQQVPLIHQLSAVSKVVWKSVFFVAFFATIISYYINQYLIQQAGTTIASLTFYLAPVFGFAFSNILLQETLSLGVIIGTLCIFISIYLVTYKSE